MRILANNLIGNQLVLHSQPFGFKPSSTFKLLLIFIVSAFTHFKSVSQTCNGTITTIAGIGIVGHYGDGGPATAAYINQVHGIIRDNYGNIYISDRPNHRIRKITSDGLMITIAGNGSGGPDGDGGPASAAKLFSPAGLAFDTSGNLYIADQNNHKIRKISTSGIISTVAGTGVSGFLGDGGQATAARL